jgi:hypothetical protein
MKNLDENFRGSLPQNTRKREDSHPDFTAKLNIWNTPYSAAAWLSQTKKNELYLALRLTSEQGSQSEEKIKLALWCNRERLTADDSHFQSVQEIFGHDFECQAWILPAGESYRLELTIKPASAPLEVLDATQGVRDRIADFLAKTGVATLPPAAKRTARLPAGDNDSDEPDDIPF